MATHKLVLRDANAPPSPELAEMAHTYGENGAYQATEKLAGKILSNGPQYYYGDGHTKSAPKCTPTQTMTAMRSEVCPVCDCGSMKIKADGRRICSRCKNEWRRPQ